ncbi:MAG: DUF4388 domain-containing protein [Gemmatimonadaceae bacterium]
MAIEGPLHELSVHDVFQLLDLSRKTGMLRVTSDSRKDEGTVYFERGRVVFADVRSNPATLDDILLRSGRVGTHDLEQARAFEAQLANGTTATDILVQAGALSARDLDRLLRQRLERVVFELMEWQEGFFSFEEREIDDVPGEARLDIATESLLMESARRIDEWSRIASKVPDVSVIPSLAPVSPEHETQLDLLPHEWEVLTMLDGERDLRAIAGELGRAEFEIAKIAYGLVTTGVIEIRRPARQRISVSIAKAAARTHTPDATVYLDRGFTAARAGDLRTACVAWEQFLALAPADPAVPRVQAALEAASRLLTALEEHTGG